MNEFLDSPFFTRSETENLFRLLNQKRHVRDEQVGRFRVDVSHWEPRYAETIVFSFTPRCREQFADSTSRKRTSYKSHSSVPGEAFVRCVGWIIPAPAAHVLYAEHKLSDTTWRELSPQPAEHGTNQVENHLRHQLTRLRVNDYSSAED